MYRVWYSTEGFADYIIENTILNTKHPIKNKIYESDANNPQNFHTVPDHIRKILYLDAPDLIVEMNNEPIFAIEVTKEAGTGHNAFQRFARIAAAVENNVPAFYIYPEAVIIQREGQRTRWDKINPLIFKALEAVMNLYNVPALLYYFPSDFQQYSSNPLDSPNKNNKGLKLDTQIGFEDCPDSLSDSMHKLFEALNEVICTIEQWGVGEGRKRLLNNMIIRQQKEYMVNQFYEKGHDEDIDIMSPLSAVKQLPTRCLLDYLSKYEKRNYKIGELLRNREYSMIYQINAGFRGDPYPGALAAIDYLKCREGRTFEDRRYNLILVFGKISIDENQILNIIDENGGTINDFFKDVQACSRHNLLLKDYRDLKSNEIPRYLMQVRYGSTFSKRKHIRVYSYFADAIIFPDGALWRDN